MLSRYVDSPMCDAELRRQTSHLVDVAGFEIAVKAEHTDLLFRFCSTPRRAKMTKQPAGKGHPIWDHTQPLMPHLEGRAMIGFRYSPMDTASAIRFLQTDRDDAGNPLHRKIPDHPVPADTALQNLRSGHLCCSVPTISERRMVSIGHQARYSFTPSPASVCDAAEVERLLHRALAEHCTYYVNIHTA